MDPANPLLWLAWATFGTFLGWLFWGRYLPALRQGPPPAALDSGGEPAAGESRAPVRSAAPQAPPAWLFCEEGSTLDRRVRWFALRPGGHTVVGSRPRSNTPETAYLYLTAEDVHEDHARVSFNPQSGRYAVETAGRGAVRHNNDPLPPGERAELADGDVLDLGEISRFRFTLSGPEAD